MKVYDKKTVEDGLYVIFDESDRFFFTGYNSTDGILLLGKKKELLIDARYYSGAKERVKEDVEVTLYKGTETLTDKLKDFCGHIYIDYKKCTVDNYTLIKKATGRIPKDFKDYVEKLRAIKTEEELNKIKSACEITERVYLETLKELKEGVTEKQIADFIKRKYFEYGGEEAFDTIVAFNGNVAVPHHESGNTVLSKNSVVLIDTGIKHSGYCSDFTRTLWYGETEDIDGEFLTDYFIVLKAHDNAVKKITSGVSLKRADGYARRVFERCGKQELFTHSLGHGVGIDIHEYPYLSPKRKGELLDGMVFTVEPGLYIDGRYGIRTEETYYLADGKPERFFEEDRYLTVVLPTGDIKKVKNAKQFAYKNKK